MPRSAGRVPTPKPAGPTTAPEPGRRRSEQLPIDHRPRAIAQRKLAEIIDHSPRLAAQAERKAEIFGAPAQRAAAGRAHPLPHAESEEEDSLQLKSDGAQLQQSDAGSSAATEPQAKGGPAGIVNRRPQAVAQRKLAEFIENSPRVTAQAKRRTESFGPAVQRASEPIKATAPQIPPEIGENKSIQLTSEARAAAPAPVKAKARPNRTGLPDGLKFGIESLSGLSMDNVKVHYNSSQPAQLDALAYAQGTEIHVAPGQEKHLPHEAWHIVQQAQGRVKPTMQLKDSVPVNDDRGLEHEADIAAATMDRMARQGPPTPQTAQPAAKQARLVAIPGSPMQLAGHAGVMIFGNHGRLFKRIERNEYDQFVFVQSQQVTERHNNNQDRTHGAFPRIDRVLEAGQLDAQEVRANYGTGATVESWLSKRRPGDYYVEMESVGGANISVLDFKVGTETANRTELMTNYGKTADEATSKVLKMAGIDMTTETSEWGLRDSDAAKASTWGNIKRLFCGLFVPTLTDIKARVQRDITDGLGAFPENSRAIRDLSNVRTYIQGADTVYIASSLVMRWNTARAMRNQDDRIVLIDLAHPMTAQMEGFNAAKAGMLLGIDSLGNVLRGGNLQ